MKACLCRFSSVFLVFSGIAFGAAGAQSKGPSATAQAVLPMETVNGHMVVELDDRILGKLRLVVDTGAEKTLLSAKVAEKGKVDRHFTDQFYSFYGFGQGKKASLIGHAQLELRAEKRELGKVEAFVLDADHLEMGMHPEPDGILGWNFFQHLCVRLDSKGKRMTIDSADRCAPSEDGFYAPPVEWLPEGLLLPMTVTLTNQKILKLKLHVDTGSDSILLSPRLRGELGLDKKPQEESKNQGTGVNGSYAWDLVYATAVEADGGHPKVEGKIPLLVPRLGSYSMPNRLFGGKDESLLFRDGVVGNSMLSLFDMIFDPGQKKLYERAYSYVPKGEAPRTEEPQ